MPGMAPRRPGQGGRAFGMNEEERAKMAELNRKVEEALAAYRAEPNDTTKAALKTQVSAMFEVRQKFAVERAEKMLAREKERLANKDKEVDKLVERIVRPRRDKPQGPPRSEHMRPMDHGIFGAPVRMEERRFGADRKTDRNGKRPADNKGPQVRALTPEENKQAQEINLKLMKADSVTPEVTRQVEALRAIHQKALTRQKEALETAKKDKKDKKQIEALERSVEFLTRSVENMKQPEKYLKQLKLRAERRGAAKEEPENDKK